MSAIKYFSMFVAGSCIALAITPGVTNAQTGMQLYMAREQMVARDVVAAGVTHPRVITALRRTPRHEFVPVAERPQAYSTWRCRSASSKTISPPFMVAT